MLSHKTRRHMSPSTLIDSLLDPNQSFNNVVLVLDDNWYFTCESHEDFRVLTILHEPDSNHTTRTVIRKRLKMSKSQAMENRVDWLEARSKLLQLLMSQPWHKWR